MDKLIKAAQFAEAREEHIALGLAAPRGSGKTLTFWSLEYWYSNVVKVFTNPKEIHPVTIGILDDFGRRFYKRDFSKVEQKEFMKFLQIVRTVFPMLIVTLPDWNLMDIDMRMFFYPIRLLDFGQLLIFGELVYVKPATASYLFEHILRSKSERSVSLSDAIGFFK